MKANPKVLVPIGILLAGILGLLGLLLTGPEPEVSPPTRLAPLVRVAERGRWVSSTVCCGRKRHFTPCWITPPPEPYGECIF